MTRAPRALPHPNSSLTAVPTRPSRPPRYLDALRVTSVETFAEAAERNILGAPTTGGIRRSPLSPTQRDFPKRAPNNPG